jgi:C-terminal processing protease CtpA/Prc
MINTNDVMRFSMDENGDEFFYNIVLYLQTCIVDSIPEYLTIYFEDGSTVTVALATIDTKAGTWTHYASLTYVQDIPIVTMRGMGFPENTDNDAVGGKEARQFLSYADNLKDEPVIIIDIRGNVGGYGYLPRRWLHQLTGNHVPPNFETLIARNYHDIQAGYVHQHSLYIPFDANHTLEYEPPDEIIASGQILILLTDRQIVSAGEDFVDRMFNMENTLVIGQNTGGSLLNASYAWLYLERTGIRFNFGSAMFVHPEGHFREGIGIAPDIWVHGDALTAALGMLEKHIR